MNNKLISINSVFCEFFHKTLKSKQSKDPLRYLKKRGLELKELNQFNLGYCDKNLTNSFIEENGFLEKDLLELGILKKSKDSGSIYPFFYNRLIFPIFDQYGKCVAFSGRRIDGIEDYKYINSQSSKIFSKKRILYALNLNYDLLLKTKFVFLAEGFLDVIALFKYDFRNVVCSMGTACTEEQVRILRRYVNKVIILYDGDNAGKEAAKKAEEILKKYVKVKKIFLPDEDDPDSFIGKYGVKKLKLYIKERI